MVGLAAQERLILKRLIFLTKQVLIKSDELSQLEFGPPMSFQFAFIACCRVVLRARLFGASEGIFAPSQREKTFASGCEIVRQSVARPPDAR